MFRDLILSFTMPRRHVLSRRTLLFERATSRLAEVEHPAMLNRAHNAAMQMPSHVWEHGVVEMLAQPIASSDYLDPKGLVDEVEEDDDELGFLPPPETVFAVERTCAILTGLAMLVANDAEEARTGDAFERLVELPFLQTRTPPDDARRIALVDNTWYYYTNSPSAPGRLKVFVRGAGLCGLVACTTALLGDARRIPGMS